MRPVENAALALSVFASVSTVARSVAAAPPVHGWSVEVSSEGADGCDRRRLLREVELACDAFGGRCRATESGGDRTARLRCGAQWTLEAFEADGALLWSVPLEGDGDRLRHAALWIARADDGVPEGAVAAPAAEPPRAVVPADVTTLAVLEVTAAPPLGREADTSVSPASPHTAPALRVGVLAAARGGFVGGGFGPLFGGRAAAALPLPLREVSATLAFAGTQTTSGPLGFGFAAGRAGLGLAWGAPWGRAPLGVALEGGVAGYDVTAPSSVSPSSQGFVRAYAEASLSAQWRPTRSIRPYATIAVSAESGTVSLAEQGVSQASIPWLSAALDVGVAWRSW